MGENERSGRNGIHNEGEFQIDGIENRKTGKGDTKNKMSVKEFTPMKKMKGKGKRWGEGKVAVCFMDWKSLIVQRPLEFYSLLGSSTNPARSCMGRDSNVGDLTKAPPTGLRRGLVGMITCELVDVQGQDNKY
jgi:hypothetical protein